MGPPSLAQDGDGQGARCPGLCVHVSERSDLLPHLGAERPLGLLADAWDRRPPAGPASPGLSPHPSPLPPPRASYSGHSQSWLAAQD